MATNLVDVAPNALTELCEALSTRGRSEIADKLRNARIARCSFDEENDIGYVYFLRPPVSLHFPNLSAPVAETLSLLGELGLNLDIDHDGEPFGLEFMARPDVTAGLRSANEL